MRKNTKTVQQVIECGIKDFEWPSYHKETDRIKQNTESYKDVTVEEAFALYYNIKINSTRAEDELMLDVSKLRPGMVIPLRIKSMDKRMTTFYNDSIKEEIVSNTNLYKYENFKHGFSDMILECKIISMDLYKMVVDPFAPMYDKWLNDALKNKNNQCDMNVDKSVTIKNLKLVSRGYNGDLVLDNISRLAGQDVCVKVFIPGSHIVLNIEKDFEQWNGKTVKAFLSNYLGGQDTNTQMSLIYSVKDYLQFEGEKFIVNAFKEWTEDSEKWTEITNTKYIGKVTGIINSSRKCGVFVEIPSLHITGMISKNASELVNYKPGDEIKVKIASFEEQTYFDKDSGQTKHKAPYIIENNILKKCNVKPILEEI